MLLLSVMDNLGGRRLFNEAVCALASLPQDNPQHISILVKAILAAQTSSMGAAFRAGRVTEKDSFLICVTSRLTFR